MTIWSFSLCIPASGLGREKTSTDTLKVQVMLWDDEEEEDGILRRRVPRARRVPLRLNRVVGIFGW